MAKIRNISGDDLIVPWLGGRVVERDEVVEVDPVLGPAYLCQGSVWKPEDDVAVALAALDADVSPPRNASTDLWRAWSAMQPGVVPDEVADSSRDDLVAAYAPAEEAASDPAAEVPTAPTASPDAVAPTPAASPFASMRS